MDLTITCKCGLRESALTMQEAIDRAEEHDEHKHNDNRTAKINGSTLPSKELQQALKDKFEEVPETKLRRQVPPHRGDPPKHTVEMNPA